MPTSSPGAAALLLAGLAVSACVDDPVRPEADSRSELRGSTSQGLARITPVGDPIWRPVDFHLFTAPIGSFETGFAEFGEVVDRLMPPPEHMPALPFYGIGPGIPHGPPYDRELAEGVTRLGFEDRHSFPASAWSAESLNGVYLVWMLVPDPGVTGRSPDFASGPIIPNSLFPMTLAGVVTRDGEPFDPAFIPPSELAPLDGTVAPRFAGVEGHSHLPIFTAESHLLAPPGTPVEGRYRFEITLRDSEGNGWDITSQFVVRKKG
ncbi:MAG TPA: hypothetical protein VFZ26_19230 [Gemmatimonadales bacterium]